MRIYDSDPKKVAAQFETIKKITMEEGYCEKLLKALGEISVGYATTTISLEFHRTFRARKIDDSLFITNVEQLWHRKSQDVTEFGRANLPYKPVLYCSEGPITAIQEVGASVGDRVAVLEMELRDKNLWPHVFSIGELRARKKTRKGVMGPARDTMLASIRAMKFDLPYSLLIDGLFADAFKILGSELYPLTAAIADMYMKPNEIDGLAYPTVAAEQGQNLALKPGSAMKFLAIRSVTISRLLKPYNERFFAKYEKVSRFVHPDGRIEWNE